MRKIRPSQVSQYLFLILFLILFIQTEYRGKDDINAAVNAFFRADPLVGLSYLLASKTFTWLLLPSALLLLATLLLGRFFCGWVCPLGTILDLFRKKSAHTGPPDFLKHNARYWLLVPLLFAALFGSNLSGLFDPLAILVRGLTFFAYPLFGDVFRSSWSGIYTIMGENRDSIEPAYTIIREYLLPFRETFYPLAFLSGMILLSVIALEKLESRCWCRRLCPLGTLLGIASRFSLFTRKPGRLCTDCCTCTELCPTSFDHELLKKEECILCMNCIEGCPSTRARFIPLLPAAEGEFLPERRVLLGGMAGGFILSRTFRFRQPDAEATLLRPPGVRNEKEFLAACVRCGECMKVCLKSALYPALLQAGAEGFYTPILLPRLGYCEYNCTLCGQVCPTGAIPQLPPEQKKREVIGKAVFDRNHCLPYAKKIDCIVCEEHCPIPKKAIRSRVVSQTTDTGEPVKLQEPYIIDELCNGCGICENVCPVEGKAGVKVFGVKDHTPLQNMFTTSPASKVS